MRKVYWLCLLMTLGRLASAQSPIARTDTTSILQGGTAIINALSNDSNLHAGDTLCIYSVFGLPVSWAVVSSCSVITYHPSDANYTGIDTFYYQVCDRHVPTLCDTGTVIVNVKRVRPLAVPDTLSITQLDTIIIHPLANDTNYHAGDSLCLRNTWSVNIGWSMVSGCKDVIYRPDSSFYGIDTIYYNVCNINQANLCDTSILVVRVTPIYPVTADDSVGLSQPGTITIDVLFNDINHHLRDTLCIASVWDTTGGWVTVSGCSSITYHPLDPDFHGVDTFYYSACDLRAPRLCDTAMVLVNVFPLPTVAHFAHLDSMCSITLVNQSTHDDLVTWELTGVNRGIHITFNYEDTIYLGWATGFVPDVYAVCLTSSNATNSSSVCDTVSYGCVGIHEIASTDLSIYPNPVADVLHVDLSRIEQATIDLLATIDIYDMLGQRLQSLPAATHTSIPVSSLAPGVYLIGLTDSSHSRSVLGKFEVLR